MVAAIQDIHCHFDWEFQEGTLENYTGDVEGPEEVDQLGMWNRYFTLAHKAKDMQAIPFLPRVNPTGVLCNMAQEDSNCMYIHTEDNQVHYYTTCQDTVGDIR